MLRCLHSDIVRIKGITQVWSLLYGASESAHANVEEYRGNYGALWCMYPYLAFVVDLILSALAVGSRSTRKGGLNVVTSIHRGIA